jgi:hypothetical protein
MHPHWQIIDASALKGMLYDVLKISSGSGLNIYIIYIGVISLSRFRSKFFLKNLRSVCFINLKNKLWSLFCKITIMKYKNLKKNYEVITSWILWKNNQKIIRSDYFINSKKKIIKAVTRGGPWVSPFMKQKLLGRNLLREDLIYGMGGRIRT